jgi:RHS repeat-associated protein
VISRHDYYPFGREVSTSSDGETHKFTGKERDVETGLYNFGARYYHETHGRFMTPDPLYLELRRLIDPQRLNLYAYAKNNPLKFIDPSGLDITCSGKRCEDYLRALQQNVSFKIAFDKSGKVVTEGEVSKKGLSNSEKELLKAIGDTKHHVKINAIDGGKDSSVFFGASQGSSHTIAFDQAALLDSPKNAGGMTSAGLVGHETMEAYAESKGKDYDSAHDYANRFFPGFDPLRRGDVSPGARTATDLLSVYMVLTIHGRGIREKVEFKFDTPIPIDSINQGTARPTPGVPVDVEKLP